MAWFLGGLAYLAGLAACSGENVVAGEGKSKAEQLQESLGDWCTKTCTKLDACNKDGGCICSGDVCDCSNRVSGDCPEDCHDDLSRWTAGDACAAALERFQKCIDRASCEFLVDQQQCDFTEAEALACPRNGSNGGDPGDVDIPPMVGSMQPGGTVTCGDGYGTGPNAPAEIQPQLVCDRGYGNCSDGHDYAIICVRTSASLQSCSCLLDGQVTGGFVPAVACPLSPEINTGCVWNLEVEEI